MKNTYVHLIIYILFVFICGYFSSKTNSYKNKLLQCDKKYGILQKTTNDMRENYPFAYMHDNVSVSGDLMLVDETENIVKFKDIICDRNKLIIVHNNLSCMPCIENVISHLFNIFSSDNYSDIILITTIPSKRDVIIFKNTYSYPGHVYRINKNNANDVLSVENESILFMINSSLVPFCVLKANKLTPDITLSYMKTIHQIFFDS